MDPISGRAAVTTAGTRERVSDTPLLLREVEIVTLHTNTTAVFVGGIDVSAVSGKERGIPLLSQEARILENVDLQNVWIDAVTDGEGITWMGRVSDVR